MKTTSMLTVSFLALVLANSCKPESTSEFDSSSKNSSKVISEFNGLKNMPEAGRATTIEEIQFNCYVVPAKVVAARSGNSPDDEDNYAGMTHVDFEITTPWSDEFIKYNLNDPGQYETRVRYCSFEMQQDIMMITTTGDTLSCEIFHFERAFNVSSTGKFFLGFRTPFSPGAQIIYEDRLFNLGKMKLTLI